MIKNIRYLGIFLALILLSTTKSVFAVTYFSQDINIECTSAGCAVLTSPTQIFYEENMLPSESSSQNLSVKNSRSEPCRLALDLRETDHSGSSSKLSNVINTKLTESSNTYFENTLESFYNSGFVPLGNISAGQTRTFGWLNTFDKNAGNEYQGLRTTFDVDINMTCDTPTSGGDGDGNDDDDDNNNSSNDDNDTTTTATSPTVAGLSTFFTALPTIEEVLGVDDTKIEDTAPEKIIVENEEVAGITTACTNPWWWWLLLLLQLVLHLIVNKSVNKDNHDEPKKFYLLSGLTTGMFTWYYYVNFCYFWDFLLALAIGLVLTAFLKRKIDKML